MESPATDYIHNAGFIETVMKHRVTLGKIYRSALRERVEALGHEVEEVGKHGMWEIMGVPEDVRDEYSSRGREIQGPWGLKPRCAAGMWPPKTPAGRKLTLHVCA